MMADGKSTEHVRFFSIEDGASGGRFRRESLPQSRNKGAEPRTWLRHNLETQYIVRAVWELGQ